MWWAVEFAGHFNVFDTGEDQPDVVFAKTVKTTATCEGVGLHSGQTVALSVLPAPAGTGILFRRIDLLQSAGPDDQASGLERVTIPAHPDAVSATTLGTVLSNRFGVTISTVEHLMAAFAGLGVTNAIVELDGPEVPIMDGSSAPFVEMIREVGLRDLPAPQMGLRLTKPVRVEIGDSVLEARPLADNEPLAMMLDVSVDYDDPAIGRQRLQMDAAHGQFCDDLAEARTFCYLRDVEMMRERGLALGGSMDNAIVVSDGKVLNEGGLRGDLEFVRHKVLDMVGDLYLLGLPLMAKITANRPGHEINTKFALEVLKLNAVEPVELSDMSVDAQQALA